MILHSSIRFALFPIFQNLVKIHLWFPKNIENERCKERHFKDLTCCTIDRDFHGEIQSMECFEEPACSFIRWEYTSPRSDNDSEIIEFEVAEIISKLNQKSGHKKQGIFLFFKENHPDSELSSQSTQSSVLIFTYAIIFVVCIFLLIKIFRKIKYLLVKMITKTTFNPNRSMSNN